MYKTKYLINLKHPLNNRPKSLAGRKPNPELWDDDTLVQRDIYYAWKKHQAQAHYRGDAHNLTLDEWRSLWTVELWAQRGRSPGCLMLVRKDKQQGWHIDNVLIVPVEEKDKYC